MTEYVGYFSDTEFRRLRHASNFKSGEEQLVSFFKDENGKIVPATTAMLSSDVKPYQTIGFCSETMTPVQLMQELGDFVARFQVGDVCNNLGEELSQIQSSLEKVNQEADPVKALKKMFSKPQFLLHHPSQRDQAHDAPEVL